MLHFRVFVGDFLRAFGCRGSAAHLPVLLHFELGLTQTMPAMQKVSPHTGFTEPLARQLAPCFAARCCTNLVDFFSYFHGAAFRLRPDLEDSLEICGGRRPRGLDGACG